MLLMKDRSFLYELSAYLIYIKVGERSFLYELRAYLTYVKVGERYMKVATDCIQQGLQYKDNIIHIKENEKSSVVWPLHLRNKFNF